MNQDIQNYEGDLDQNQKVDSKDTDTMLMQFGGIRNLTNDPKFIFSYFKNIQS